MRTRVETRAVPADTLADDTRESGWARLATLTRRTWRAFGFLTVFVMLAGTLFISTEPPAQALGACTVVPEISGYGPETIGSGGEELFGPKGPINAGLVPAPQGSGSAEQWDNLKTGPGRDINLFEYAGTRGLSWTVTERTDDNGEACNLLAYMGTFASQMIFDVERNITNGAIVMRRHASDGDPFVGLMAAGSSFVTGGRLLIFGAALPIVVILTGFWVMSKVRGQQTREMWSGLLSMALCIIACAFLLAPSGTRYEELPEYSVTGVAGEEDIGGEIGGIELTGPQLFSEAPNFVMLTRWLTRAVDGAESTVAQWLTDSTKEGGVCDANYKGRHSGQRIIDCNVWKTMAFDPWVRGQFGTDSGDPELWVDEDDVKYNGNEDERLDKGEYLPRVMMIAGGVTWKNFYNGWSSGPINFDNFDEGKFQNWNRVREVLRLRSHSDDRDARQDQSEETVMYTMWKGDSPNTRLAAAMSGLITGAIIGTFTIVTSLIVLLWNAVPVLLLFVLPIVGLIAAFPPQQRLLRSWGQTWVKSAVIAFVGTVAQIVLLGVANAIIGSGLSLGLRAILLLIMVLALWKVIQAAREDAFTPNLAGGQSGMFDADSAASSAYGMGRKGASRTRQMGEGVRDRTSQYRRRRQLRRDEGGRVPGGVTTPPTDSGPGRFGERQTLRRDGSSERSKGRSYWKYDRDGNITESRRLPLQKNPDAPNSGAKSGASSNGRRPNAAEADSSQDAEDAGKGNRVASQTTGPSGGPPAGEKPAPESSEPAGEKPAPKDAEDAGKSNRVTSDTAAPNSGPPAGEKPGPKSSGGGQPSGTTQSPRTPKDGGKDERVTNRDEESPGGRTPRDDS